VDIHTRFARLLGIASIVAILGGCAAASVAISKKDLEVQTKTSTAIFVDPVARPERTIFLDIRSGIQEFDRRAFTKFVKDQFAVNENGYKIIDDPDKAHYIMLIYVLNLEKANPTAAQSALQQGYSSGGAIAAGAAAGAVIGSNRNGYGAYRGAAVGGLAAGAASLVADNAVHDVTYMLVCDISIRERVAKGVMVRKDTQINAKVSDAGSSQQRVSEVSDRKEYRTRIVTTANKVNLELAEAQDTMFSKTAYAMSGFF
jgi:hypothetical protein